MAQTWISRGMQALNILMDWNNTAGEEGFWDLSGMAVEATYRGHVFGQMLESTLDYIVVDGRTASRWTAADNRARRTPSPRTTGPCSRPSR